MKTPRQVLTEDDAERARVFRPSHRDGLLIVLLKLGFHYRIWQWGSRAFGRQALRIAGRLDRPTSDTRAIAAARWAADAYSVLSSSLLAASYAAIYAACRPGGPGPDWAVALLLFYPAARTGEILSVTVLHNASGPYRSRAPLRAVSRIFSGGSHLLATWLDPLYFSLTTISTAGFGDYAPRRAPGKLLVMAELLIGIVLVVLAVQRALAASAQAIEEERGMDERPILDERPTARARPPRLYGSCPFGGNHPRALYGSRRRSRANRGSSG